MEEKPGKENDFKIEYENIGEFQDEPRAEESN